MEDVAGIDDLDDDFYANTYTEEDRAAFEAEPESPRRFLVAWAWPCSWARSGLSGTTWD